MYLNEIPIIIYVLMIFVNWSVLRGKIYAILDISKESCREVSI